MFRLVSISLTINKLNQSKSTTSSVLMNDIFPTETSVNNTLPNASGLVRLEDLFPHQIVNGYDKCDIGNGNLNNFKKCDSNRCKEFGPRFLPSDKVYSASTGRYFDCINEDYPNVVNCHSANLIYVITCANCLLQYVGETVVEINKRFTTHRACMRGEAYSTGCQRLGEHFSSGPCKGSEYFVQVVDKLSGSGRIGKDVDPRITKERRKREDQWMLKLRTVYPYGFNDALNEIIETSGGIGRPFPSLPRAHSRPSIRSVSKNTKLLDHDLFLTKFRHLLCNQLRSVAHFLRVSLFSMRKADLNKIAQRINEMLLEDECVLFNTWYRMALDIIETRIYKPPPEKKKKKIPKYKVTIPFVNKAMDFINLPKLLRSNELQCNMPPVMEDGDIPMVVYSLSQPIRSKILNYKKFVLNELDLVKFSQNSKSIACNCKNYSDEFMDKNRGHVLTGNLKIIQNNKLRKIFSKGPKFREPEKIDWDKARVTIHSGIETFIKNMAEVKRVDETYFDNWKFSLFELVGERITALSNKVVVREIKSVFKDADVKIELDKLHKDFVVVPIDKASNNVSFICKNHYADVIKSELKFSLQTDNYNTYEHVNTPSNEIIKSHSDMLNKFDLVLKEEMKVLACLYWSPKLHKDPIGERYIIASPECSVKPLLKDVTSILKLFQSNLKHFHDKNRIWTNVSNFWVIQNNQPVVDRISKINNAKKAKSIRTFDFSTLYTKIPHNLLKDAMKEIVDFCFKGGLSYGVYITSNGAFWRKPKGDFRFYSKQDIKDVLDFVIDNAYFHVNNEIFRQIIGIPMGSDPAPFIANLFLYLYENRFMNKLKKEDLRRARKLRHVFRFIDDLIALNDDDEFLRSYAEIYPKEMELKPENQSTESGSYLDLNLKIDEKVSIR